VLGAAAFLIAEFLKISYLDVLLMATIPTLLYYLALFVMVEIDVRKFGMKDVTFERVESAWSLTKKYWFPLPVAGSIIAFMLWASRRWRRCSGRPWSRSSRASCAAIPRSSRMTYSRGKNPRGAACGARPRQGALRRLARVLNVAATCAGAGIIVGTVTLTGLGLKFSSIVLQYAGGSLLLTAIYTSLIVWIVGLAYRDGELHHLRGDRRAGADRAQGARFRGAYVHLLLRRAVRGLAADRALALCRRRDHRRRSVQDDAAMLEIHRARVPRALHVRARPSGTGLLLTGSFKTLGNADWARSRSSRSPRRWASSRWGRFQGWLLKRTSLPSGRCSSSPDSFSSIRRRCSTSSDFALVVIVVLMQWFKKDVPAKHAA